MQVTVLLLLIERGATLLEKDTFHPLNYIMKEEYSGSMEGMRYMLKRSRSGEEDITIPPARDTGSMWYTVLAFFLLGIYRRAVWMLLGVLVLGIGHIGIHLQHRKRARKDVR